ncbi:MAG: tetratricopeptide repeat protein [Gammaproteobacteria bacterium]
MTGRRLCPTLCLACWLCTGCGAPETPAQLQAAPAPPQVALLEISHPDPLAFKPEITASLAPALARFRTESTTLDGVDLGAAFGKLGLHYQAHQQQEAAAACFINAQRLDPTNHRWPYYLAVHEEETGEFDNAIANYKQSLELVPDNVAGATRLGLLILQLGDLEPAQRVLDDVIARQPNSAAALAGLADIAADRDDPQTAAQLYQQALSIDPQASQLYYRLGLTYRKLGDIERAKAALSQRGERIPRIADPLLVIMQAHLHPPAYYIDQANAALEANDLRRSAQRLSLALTVEPTHAQALTQLGELLLAVKQDAAAKKQFEQLVQAHPDHALGHYYLGLCAVRAGDKPTATRHMREALKLEPGMERATKALQRLTTG